MQKRDLFKTANYFNYCLGAFLKMWWSQFLERLCKNGLQQDYYLEQNLTLNSEKVALYMKIIINFHVCNIHELSVDLPQNLPII